jgi:hypothetical protein
MKVDNDDDDDDGDRVGNESSDDLAYYSFFEQVEHEFIVSSANRARLLLTRGRDVSRA